MKLTENFMATKQFCDTHELKINTAKTQLVIFKSVSKVVPPDFELLLDGCPIKPVRSMKILGVTLDHHFTLSEHIDIIVRKCHGLIGALSRAVPFLPRSLLKLAYSALIRTHLEYCSAILSMASKTQLSKLDTIQRIAARIIHGVPRDAHSEPLLRALRLEPLEERRTNHIVALVNSILAENCHPAFNNLFTVQLDGTIHDTTRSRLKVGSKRFSIMGARLFNEEHFRKQLSTTS